MTARSATLGGSAIRATRLSQAIALLDRFPPSLLQLIFRIAIAAVFQVLCAVAPTPEIGRSVWRHCCGLD